MLKDWDPHEVALPSRIIKQYYLDAKPQDELRIYDGGADRPYTFSCPNCGQHESLIQVQFDPFNWKAFSLESLPISLEEWRRYGGGGSFYKLLQCICGGQYFVGIGYFEQQPSRDVFVLHTILEVA